jgi:glutathione S-transferase
MKLYHFPISPNSRRVWAVINHLGLDCEYITLDLLNGEQMSPEFVALNPNHMIPTLVDDDLVLWESHAIMIYLCEKTAGQNLLPTDTKARADVMRWLFWNTAHWNNTCGIFVFERLVKPALKMGDADAAKIAEGTERFQRFGAVLDKHLANRRWLCGEQFTLADYAVGSMLALADKVAMPWADFTHVKRWWGTIETTDAWQRTNPN